MHRIGSEHFDWLKDSKCFCQEISCLPEQFSAFFDDTIVLVGEKTGKEIVFEFAGTDTDNEGEIMGWKFKSIANNMGVANAFNLLIIND